MCTERDLKKKKSHSAEVTLFLSKNVRNNSQEDQTTFQ